MGDTDAADEFDAMSTQEYIDHRGLNVVDNPRRKRFMANNGPTTKADLEDVIDQVQSILESAYTPESSREDLAAAVGDALDALNGEAEDDSDEDLDDSEDEDANGD